MKMWKYLNRHSTNNDKATIIAYDLQRLLYPHILHEPPLASFEVILLQSSAPKIPFLGFCYSNSHKYVYGEVME